MSVSGNVTINTSFTQVAVGLPGNQAAALTNAQSFKVIYNPAGSGADQIALKYSAKLTLSAAPLVLNLQALTDVFGAALSFSLVRSITIVNESTTNGQTVLMGYSTTTANAWVSLVSNPGQITIEPSTAANQGFFAMTAPNTTGWAVGASNRMLQLDPGANTIVVDVEITGA